MTDLSSANLKLFNRHAIMISISIAVSCSWVITDLLLLNLEFDLTKFGLIKSSMFLLPAVSYFAATGFLRRLDRDLAVAAHAYLWRVLLPLLLTVVAYFCHSQTILLWTAAIIFSTSYSCAMFANNTLLKLYRRTLSPADFNRGSMYLPALMGLPAAIIGLVSIPLLYHFSGDRQAFLLCLFLLQFVTLFFQCPAIRAIMAVRFPETAAPAEAQEKTPRPLLRDLLRDGRMMRLLSLMLAHGVWIGLVSTYFVVYLLKCRGVNPSLLVGAELVLGILVFASAGKVGRLAGKVGYRKIFSIATLVILVTQAAWLAMPGSTALLVVFGILIYNANNGLAAVLCRQLEGTCSAALAKPGQDELCIAAGTLVSSLGCFAGCLAAGKLFGVLGGEELARFIPYFRCTLVLPLVMFLCTLPLPKFRKK